MVFSVCLLEQRRKASTNPYNIQLYMADPSYEVSGVSCGILWQRQVCDHRRQFCSDADLFHCLIPRKPEAEGCVWLGMHLDHSDVGRTGRYQRCGLKDARNSSQNRDAEPGLDEFGGLIPTLPLSIAL
jgi:hypothetical protein